ncbi:mannonate dehydratase [Adhaeribacter radiodurans]|uniref:mannonate dehydratase n=1 Tax=Adhaeribacter radiodurans TaxID=2745197 RepID=A0A7L7L646_9BACT|nr:mannonate dehydratase [Adhaeribacter radiodurans]QMU28253.1 mannonate dehydratase [Adhaeribacter radiodurans]
MQDNRRNFIKKSASLAAALSIGGTTSAMANHLISKEKPNKLKAFARDAGLKFALAMSPDSPRVPFAKQIDVRHAVSGIIKTANLKPWEPEAIKATKAAWDKEGIKWTVVEGPPSLGEQTKLALSGRDEEIANFITFMKNLKQYGGVDVICYNWMPVISWARTTMDRPGRGGALVTSFDNDDIKNKPLTKYGEVSKEAMWKNLEYFLKAVVPEAEKIGMNLSLHPDDPQVHSIQGISRIMNTVENFDRMLKLVPSKYSGLTMCQGNFSLMGTDIPALIRRWGKAGKINFVHFRNVQDLSGVLPSTKFTETFHDEGQIDMHAAMQAYYDIGFKGTIRPDHVPTMHGEENTRPGYMNLGTLYAIGYMRGLAESIAKANAKA